MAEKAELQNDCSREPTQDAKPVQFFEAKPKGELSSVKGWIYFIIFPCTHFVTWGMISAFPVLFVAFLEKFHRSRSETSTIGSLQVGLLYMLAVIPGYFIPICGFRIILIVGCLITATGFISSMFVTEMHVLYVTMGVVTSLGASFMMTVSDSAPLVTFKKWRSLSTIICSAFASLGFAVVPLTMNYLIRTYALNGALLIFAGIILQVLVLAMLFPLKNEKSLSSTTSQIDLHDKTFNDDKDKQKPMTTVQKYKKILKTPSFWCVAAAGLAIDSLSNGCRVFLVDRAILQGISKSNAVMSISLWGIFSAGSKLLVQIPFINRSAKRRQVALVIATLCWSLVTLGSVMFKSYEGFVAYCILAGVCHGINSLLWYLVLADIIERELVVPAYSLQCVIAGPFVTFSVPIAGLIYDRTQSYDVPYIIYGCIGLFGTIWEAFIPYCENKTQKKHVLTSPSYSNAA